MSLECIQSEVSRLIYEQKKFKSLDLYEWNFSQKGYVRKDTIRGRNNGNLTYSVREDLSSRQYVFCGTGISAGFDTCGETRYWATQRVIPWSKGNPKIVEGERYWQIETEGVRPDQAERTFKNDIRYITENTYRKIVDDNYQITQSDYGAQIRIYKGARCQRNSPSSAIVDLVKTLDFRPLVNRSSWFVDFFEDGVLIETLSIKSPTDKPFVVPEIIVDSREKEELSTFELTISKIANTEAIEVLVNPDSPHQNLVYKVELDKNLNEINRRLIHLFSSRSGQPPPEYELICGKVKECPDNTYQFDCGEYLCCYKPDGYASSRINK